MQVVAKEELLKRVNGHRWFHIIDLGDGVVTPGTYDPVAGVHGPRFCVPESLEGKTVLDIGAWDGAWSFEAKRRGATRVVATDYFCWGGGGWGDPEAFRIAREALELDVEDVNIDVYDLSRERIGQFDVVFFFGVLYHLCHPMLALEKLRDVTAPGGLAIVETHCAMLDVDTPALAFYPTTEEGNDPTNWFGPNPDALFAMLEACGVNDNRLAWLDPAWKRMTVHAR